MRLPAKTAAISAPSIFGKTVGTGSMLTAVSDPLNLKKERTD
jgi:hypothetical protein